MPPAMTAVKDAPDSTRGDSSSAEGVLYRQPPANIEAEQGLLGAILVNNEALHHIGDRLRPTHFYEPVHQRIFDAITKFHDRGQIANPVTLKHFFDQDQSLADIGGGQYLAKLAGAALTVINVSDFSQMIYDLALKRELIGIGEEVVNTAYDNHIDAAATQQIEAAEQKLFELSAAGERESGFRALRHSVADAIKRTEHAYKNSGRVVGVSTGFDDLNEMLGGLQRSDLVILAGRPSMGKTALATNLAYNAAKYFVAQAEGKDSKELQSVGFFSLEMSAEQLATRVLAGVAKLSSSKLLHGHLQSDEFVNLTRASNELAALPFHIDETPALSISALRSRARRLKRTQNLGLIVVDYLQLVRPSNSVNMNNRVQEVSEITQGLKAIAKELGVPVLALSQLSRAVEQRDDKRPLLSDLRESGSIEQDADVVMFIFREEYYVGRKEPDMNKADEYAKWQQEMDRVHNVAEVIVAKHRNGPIGTAKLHFDSSLTLFSNLAKTGY